MDPLNIIEGTRFLDICAEFNNRNIAIFILQGTCKKQLYDGQRNWTEHNEHYWTFHWGWAPKATHSNKSCGITICLHRARFELKQVVEISSPELALAGRGGSLRIKTLHEDINVMGLYYPPFTGVSRNYKKHIACVRHLNTWAQKVLHAMPNRCSPIVGLDGNGRVGLLRQAGEPGPVPLVSNSFGGQQPELQNLNGTELQAMCEHEFLTMANTHFESTPTYYGVHGTSRIDYILIPLGMMSRVSRCSVNFNLGKRLQHIASQQPRDHYPLQLVVNMSLQYHPKVNSIQWDRDMIIRGVKHGTNKDRFVGDMCNWCVEHRNEWLQCITQPNPDAASTLLNQTMIEIGQKYFAPKKQPEQLRIQEAKKARANALAQRRQLKDQWIIASVKHWINPTLRQLFDTFKGQCTLDKADRHVRKLQKEHKELLNNMRVGELDDAWRTRSTQYMGVVKTYSRNK